MVQHAVFRQLYAAQMGKVGSKSVSRRRSLHNVLVSSIKTGPFVACCSNLGCAYMVLINCAAWRYASSGMQALEFLQARLLNYKYPFVLAGCSSGRGGGHAMGSI